MRRGPGLLWRDLGVAVVAVALDTVLFTGLSQEAEQVGWAGPQPGWLVVLAGAFSLPLLALRRRSPARVCLAMSTYAVAVTVTLGSRPLVSLLVALYSAAVLGGLSRALVCLSSVLAAHSAAVAYEGSFPNVTAGDVALIAILYSVLDLTTWAAGRWGAGAGARARATELEASRARLAQQAVADERLRIARELHDIVAHAVTAMTLQAAGASRVLATDPGRAAQAMGSVEVLGQQAIAELRRLLAVLRAGDDREHPPATDHGVAEIPALLRTFESSGIPVRFESHGQECELDPSVNLAAYRLVQESLTNAAKHADGAPVEVVASWRTGSFDLKVVNDLVERAPVSGDPSGGYGLVGLRERVRLLGGTFTAETRDDGKFVVCASLPTSGTFRTPVASSPAPPASSHRRRSAP
jgi:signal transduction histidine kinase